MTVARRPLVVSGDSQAAAMCVAILEAAGLEPGYLLPSGAREPVARRKIVGGSAKPPPFVVLAESFVPAALPETIVALVGTEAPSVDAQLVVCDARSSHAAALEAAGNATFYGIDGEASVVTPGWLAATVPVDAASGAQPFDLYAGGSSCGRFAMRAPSGDAVRSAVAAIAACAEGFNVHIEKARIALASFGGAP